MSFEGTPENIPKIFDVVVELEDGKDILTRITEKAGIELAVCVDLKSGKLYIGEGHEDILSRHPIPERNRCTASALFDGLEDVTVAIYDYAFGAPKRPIEPDVLRDRMVAALRRDILGKQD